MRTLKKALSLVLVLAMVLSLGVSAFAVDKASQFSDYGTVTNKEAVDVLTAIGVINGNTDGTFGPSGNFTRAQAATMISYLTLGKTVANALPVGATQFDDVPATHWAAKYVQYCANEGIINGYGDGKFGPDDKLTVNQWALMLLGALGYKAANENIGGAGWEIQVTKLAMNAGVATADELVATFNRDMAAKLALNTLTAKSVTYSGGSNITINGAVISQGATRVEGAVLYTVKSTAKTYDNLVRSEIAADDFGRPAHKWTMGAGNKTTIGTYGDAAVATYTTPVDGKTVYAALSLAAAPDHVTGKVTGTAATNLETNFAELAGGASGTTPANFFTATSKNTIGGYGVVTEFYKTVNETNNEVTVNIVQVAPSFGKVAVRNVAATSAHGAYTNYQINNVSTAYGKIYSSVVDAATEKDSAFITGSVANDDYVLYYKVGNNLYLESVKTITGTLTSVSSNGNLTIDGTTYKKAAIGDTVTAKKDAQTFYVDSYGNVIQATVAVDNTKIVLALKKDTVNTLNGTKLETVYNVDVVNMDGTVETLQVANETAQTNVAAGTVYTYTTNTKGISTLTPAATVANQYTIEAITAISNKNATMKTTADADATLKATANTKFYFVNWDKDDAGDPVVTGTLTTYTGTTAVPSFTGLVNTTAVDSNADGLADVVFVYGKASATVSDKYVFALGTYNTTADGTAIDVIIKGEQTTMTVKDATVAASIAKDMYSELTFKADGTVQTKNAATGAVQWAKVTGGLYGTGTESNGVVTYTYTGTTIADDVPVYVITGTSCETLTASSMADGTYADEIYVVTSNGAVTAVYMVNE